MIKLALRNIFRNGRRTVLTGMSICFAVMIVIYLWSLVMGILEGSFNYSILSDYGHIKITNAGYVKREKMMPISYNIPSWADIAGAASKDPEVVLYSGRIKFGVLLENKGSTKPALGIGVDPGSERPFLDLSEKVFKGRLIYPDAQEINIGHALAQELGLNVGDEITLVTQTQYNSITAMNLKVAGLISFGIATVDKKVFYLPLVKAQELLDMPGAVTEILLMTKDKETARVTAARIQAGLDKKDPGALKARAWQDQMKFYPWLTLTRRIYGFIYAIVLILASFTILNTMFMAALERTKEIGMMKALGMKNKEIVLLVICEAAIIGVIASFIGAILGALISYYLSVYGIDFSAAFEKVDMNVAVPYVYKALFRWSYVITGFLFGVFFSTLAALPPALRAAKMEPTEALHEN
jgi:putative ABC transport system permease protein